MVQLCAFFIATRSAQVSCAGTACLHYPILFLRNSEAFKRKHFRQVLKKTMQFLFQNLKQRTIKF